MYNNIHTIFHINHILQHGDIKLDGLIPFRLYKRYKCDTRLNIMSQHGSLFFEENEIYPNKWRNNGSWIFDNLPPSYNIKWKGEIIRADTKENAIDFLKSEIKKLK